jgi:Ca2+-transporting ATPase
MHATDVRRPGATEVVERPHALPADDVAARLHVDPATGLSAAAAKRRRDEVGPNALPAPRRTPLWSRFLIQFRDPMALLLLAAAVLSATLLGERLEAAAIAVLVLINAVIATAQEGRAASALAALRRLEVPEARVRRDGVAHVVAAVDVVPGDIVLLESGDRVPADLRLVRADQLEVDESILTGESLPATKDPDVVADVEAGLGDRRGVVHSGTFVTRGTAEGVVVATGTMTQLGAIAEQIEPGPPTTPLQRDLSDVTRRLATVALLIAAAVLLLTVLRTGVDRESIEQSVLAAVALAVAAIPEGLATVTAVGLALGVRRMADHGAIIRRLPAVETLGAASVLVIDKTGTLTENRLALDRVVLDGGSAPADEPQRSADVEVLRRIAVLCNDATLDPAVGDPTELALLGVLDPDVIADVRRRWPRLASAPFEATRKRMSTVHRAPDGTPWLFVKGAPESVVERCASIRNDGSAVALDDLARGRISEVAASAAAGGQRVLAFAQRPLGSTPVDVDAEVRDLELIGLITMRDQMRSTAAQSVAAVKAAGVTLVMATGDHPGTATAIADDVDLSRTGVAITGAELRSNGFASDPAATPVYARVDPDQKLALVETLQAQGRVVAMTGDGVNDAPALRRADIGIALGRRGSDVAREAADMVITDDDLATIVLAIREGRGIFDNIRKVVDYLVAGNLAEIIVVVTGLLAVPAMGVPLLPLQLLWINLITDGMPAVTLGTDPVDEALMRRPPRSPHLRLLAWNRLRGLILNAVVLATGPLVAMTTVRLALDLTWPQARTVLFTALVVAHMLYATVVRRGSGSVFRNPWLLAAVAGGVLAQVVIVLWSPAHAVFTTTTLDVSAWLITAAGGILPILVIRVLTGWRQVTGPARSM